MVGKNGGHCQCPAAAAEAKRSAGIGLDDQRRTKRARGSASKPQERSDVDGGKIQEIGCAGGVGGVDGEGSAGGG
jgi:hypothetical protein